MLSAGGNVQAVVAAIIARLKTVIRVVTGGTGGTADPMVVYFGRLLPPMPTVMKAMVCLYAAGEMESNATVCKYGLHLAQCSHSSCVPAGPQISVFGRSSDAKNSYCSTDGAASVLCADFGIGWQPIQPPIVEPNIDNLTSG